MTRTSLLLIALLWAIYSAAFYHEVWILAITSVWLLILHGIVSWMNINAHFESMGLCLDRAHKNVMETKDAYFWEAYEEVRRTRSC